MRTSPAPTNPPRPGASLLFYTTCQSDDWRSRKRPSRAGFTLPETLVAMLLVVLTVFASVSALITVLRLDDAGLHALRASCALRQCACRHLLPAKSFPEEAPHAGHPFFHPPRIECRADWIIYTLTPLNDSDSMPIQLATVTSPLNE